MKKLSIFLTTVFLFLACSKVEKVEIERTFDGPEINKAVAIVHPIGDSGVSGTVTFTKENEGVRVEASITGLSAGEHGFHIHQYGDCTASDGTSAGGHYNPEENDHNSPDADMRHMGDMGNLTSEGPDQTTTYSYLDEVIALPMIAGRGIIIHAGQDDLSSQPSGAAGSRIACGVIGIAE